MNLDEQRIEAAKISIAIAMNGNDTEPLKYVSMIEEYIRTGRVPKIVIKR
jgi:hypothetical protein